MSTPNPPGPLHGRGSLAHGYVEGACDDWCNNVACRDGLVHERCVESCSPPVRYDDIGGWQISEVDRVEHPI
jgi:hypothetical protein